MGSAKNLGMKTEHMPDEPETSPEAHSDEQRRALALDKVLALSASLTSKRDEAIQARMNSGIEDDWLEDEEFYQGIDDANREFQRSRSKPLSPEGGSDKAVNNEVRSRVFLNITRPYVDAAAAKVSDMLLPTDDQNWDIQETPIPDMVKASKDMSPLLDPNTRQPLLKTVPMEDGSQQQQPMTVADQAKEIINKAKDSAKAAATRIDDWLQECNYNSETRKAIEYCARLGTGVMKGPYPVARGRRAISREGGMVKVIEQVVVGPESRSISPWNLYPDPNCGNDIHRGSFIFEKDKITVRQLHDLLEDDSYIPETIMQALREGPQKKLVEENKTEKGTVDLDDKDQYEIWYYHGFIGHEEMEAAGCECDELDKIPAILVMVNDLVIKAAINPLESGEFPYDVMVWQARDDYWAGVGVARQMRPAQRILNASIRNMMDNAGLTSGPQILFKEGAVEPYDGIYRIVPRKLWKVLEDFEGTVQDALAAVNIPTMQQELMGIIQFALKIAEDITGLPMLLQGQQGKAPETVGGMQMLNNNASTVMRRIARTYDDCVTEPHIRRYYAWLLLDPDVPDVEKGDFKIVARGSSALVERDLQNQTIAQMGAMVKDPSFGIDPKRWVGEYFKSQRLDPRLFQYTEEELKQLAEQQAKNPPVDPSVQVAQIRAQTEMERAKLDAQDREAERNFKLQLAQLERDTQMMKFASERNISLENIKADLAKTATVEKTKRDLFNAESQLKQTAGSGI
jgi:hypothetical protein